MKFVLISEDDLEQVYAEQYPDMIEFVPFGGEDDYNEVYLIEFKDEKEFMTFCADMWLIVHAVIIYSLLKQNNMIKKSPRGWGLWGYSSKNTLIPWASSSSSIFL